MKKLLISVIFINILFFNVLSFASSKELSHFIVRFETGNVYDVTIKENLLRWKGVAGEDLNVIMEIPYKHISLSRDIDVYQ